MTLFHSAPTSVVNEGAPDAPLSRRARRRRETLRDAQERSIISVADLKRPKVRITLNVAIVLGLLLFALIGLGPCCGW